VHRPPGDGLTHGEPLVDESAGSIGSETEFDVPCRLEHVELQERPGCAGPIHQGATDPAALVIRVDEDCPDFVPDQGKQAPNPTIGLVDDRVGDRKPVFGNLFACATTDAPYQTSRTSLRSSAE